MKICSKCKEKKEVINFCLKKSSKDGLNNICKSCKKIYNKSRKKENSNYFKKYRKENPNKFSKYKEKHKENNNILTKKYYYKNKEKIFKRKYYRYHNDFIYKIIHILRTRINEKLKNNKKDKSILLLGCTLIFYKQYLENLFLEGMNWENYGKVWEIDHIKPICNFDILKREEQLEAFNYKNTRPIFKTTEIALDLGYKNEIGNRNRKRKL